jgi:hypothetical protein
VVKPRALIILLQQARLLCVPSFVGISVVIVGAASDNLDKRRIPSVGDIGFRVRTVSLETVFEF